VCAQTFNREKLKPPGIHDPTMAVSSVNSNRLINFFAISIRHRLLRYAHGTSHSRTEGGAAESNRATLREAPTRAAVTERRQGRRLAELGALGAARIATLDRDFASNRRLRHRSCQLKHAVTVRSRDLLRLYTLGKLD
jgi:hypothetical protein